jgi:hypothetical protein
MHGMDGTTRSAGERRKAKMAVARVSWEDRDETVHTAPARIKDRSPSGACFRLKVAIEAGTQIHVSWCRDDFSGTAKWCRAEDGEYVVGMQRDRIVRPAPARMTPQLNASRAREAEMGPAVRVDTPRVREAEQASVRDVDVVVDAVPIAETLSSLPAQRRVIRRGTLIPIPVPTPLPLMRITFPPAEIHEPVIGFEIARDNWMQQTSAREPTVPDVPHQNRTRSFFEERIDMQNKWLDLGNRRQQQDGVNGGNGGPVMAGDSALTAPRGDLLLLEDIYRTAGIMEPRMGYSITKVVEMLRSDHLRGLGDEVKRASVLMALNAAGIPLGDILQHAAHRQSAVAAYEVEQRKKFEEYWTRRAEENSQLQAEMERVTRQYVERMNRNLTEVQQEKEAFRKWQSGMQFEVLRISEAVTLCAQPAVFETPAEQPAAAVGGQSLVAKSA